VKQSRDTYYGETHFQSILFQISQRIVDELLSPTNTQQDKKARVMRLQSRHQLFPQVLKFVTTYAASGVKYNGVDRRELGLEKYARLVIERIRERVYPDDAAGEPPLLPVLNRYRPTGSTNGVDFVTKRPVRPTKNSHINLVVQHSTWEADAAEKLEGCAAVSYYARNDHLGLTVPYDFYGLSHSYEPDFLVRLVNNVTLILEVKGYEVHELERTQHKHNAARRWVDAVNNLGEFGRWDFLVCRDVPSLPKALASLARPAATVAAAA
jgi:type III restriction enzyme